MHGNCLKLDFAHGILILDFYAPMRERKAPMQQTMHSPANDRRTLKRTGWALFILSPFLLLLILSLAAGHSVLDAYPVWSDELCFWRTLYSWDEAGMATGYYGMHEQIAPIGTMGTSGIGPILLYGWFVKLFGLSHNTIMLANAVWCSAAAAVFCLLRKPRFSVSLLMSGIMMAYAPIILYAATSMTQWFNYALVLLYITFLLGYQERRKGWLLVLCVLTIVLGALYRPMYCLLFLPVLLLYCRYQFNWRMLGFGIPALVISLICCYVAMQTAAPYASGFVYHLLRADSLTIAWHMLLSHTKSNLIDYFVRASGSPMQDAFRYLYCGITGLCLVSSFIRTDRTETGRLCLRAGYRGPIMSCFLLLIAAYGFTMVFYEANDWADLRQLAPYLWLVAAYLIARHRRVIPLATLAGCAVSLALLIAQPEGVFTDTNRFAVPAASQHLPAVTETIVFDENAADPFENTVRVDVYDYELLRQLDPALGLQYGWFTTDTVEKSRWVLTDKLKCPITGYENVLETPDFKVYRHIEED